VDDYEGVEAETTGVLPKLLFKLYYRLRLKALDFKDMSELSFYKKQILEKQILFVRGWSFGSHETTLRYRPLYQKIFSPKKDMSCLEQSFLARCENEKIIAVHIRRGDYADHLGGIYFFDDAFYINLMVKMKEQLDGSCRFIIFSNDPDINEQNFRKHFEDVRFSYSDASADHYLMGKCDFIIGPPSTFSMWASYIGETPYCHIREKDATVKLSDFKICDGLSNDYVV
jgi:hypothetical protein